MIQHDSQSSFIKVCLPQSFLCFTLSSFFPFIFFVIVHSKFLLRFLVGCFDSLQWFSVSSVRICQISSFSFDIFLRFIIPLSWNYRFLLRVLSACFLFKLITRIVFSSCFYAQFRALISRIWDFHSQSSTREAWFYSRHGSHIGGWKGNHLCKQLCWSYCFLVYFAFVRNMSFDFTWVSSFCQNERILFSILHIQFWF